MHPAAHLPDAMRFATSLLYKDVRLCVEEAEAASALLWLGPIGRRLERRSTHRLTCGRDASALSEICERPLKEPLLPPVGQVVELMATIHRAKGRPDLARSGRPRDRRFR